MCSSELDMEEGFAKKLDVIIESVVEPRKLVWKSPAQYISWHHPSKFFEYQLGLKGRIADFAAGTKFCGLYNISEDKLVIDLVDSPKEIIEATGWTWDNTVRIVVADKVILDHMHPDGDAICEEIKKAPIWPMFEQCI